jgi:hypothetical protein
MLHNRIRKASLEEQVKLPDCIIPLPNVGEQECAAAMEVASGLEIESQVQVVPDCDGKRRKWCWYWRNPEKLAPKKATPKKVAGGKRAKKTDEDDNDDEASPSKKTKAKDGKWSYLIRICLVANTFSVSTNRQHHPLLVTPSSLPILEDASGVYKANVAEYRYPDLDCPIILPSSLRRWLCRTGPFGMVSKRLVWTKSLAMLFVR